MSGTPPLSVEGLTVRFGGLTAVNNVSFAVDEGQIFSVIGPNGAGKTTVFNAITGLVDPTEGRIRVSGAEAEKRITAKTLAGFSLAAALTGVGCFLLFNLDSLWTNAINANYVYRQPFPWRNALQGFADTVDALPFRQSSGLTLLAGMIGFLGAWSVWRRFRRTPDVVTSHGIARTFQNIRLFRQMTALENVLLGNETKLRSSLFSGVVGTRAYREEEMHARDNARELLRFVGLEEEGDLIAANLPYGHQRRLEIARALASQPKVILLDEPAAGMNPSEARELTELIQRIRERGVTVVLIEHHMDVVMSISDRILVLDFGNPIAEGTPQEIKCNPRVIEAYLGKEATA